jgi:hypothetical protein
MQRVILVLATDRDKARIPILQHKEGEQVTTVSTNREKSIMLTKGFFPAKPQNDKMQPGHKYLRP